MLKKKCIGIYVFFKSSNVKTLEWSPTQLFVEIKLKTYPIFEIIDLGKLQIK